MPTALESVIELIGLIVIFLVVLVACYFTTKFIAGKQMGQKRIGNFEVIETFAISQNKYLQLVRTGNKYIVISVTKEAVSFITELDENEVVRLQAKEPVQAKSFKDILSSLSKKEK